MLRRDFLKHSLAALAACLLPWRTAKPAALPLEPWTLRYVTPAGSVTIEEVQCVWDLTCGSVSARGVLRGFTQRDRHILLLPGGELIETDGRRTRRHWCRPGRYVCPRRLDVLQVRGSECVCVRWEAARIPESALHSVWDDRPV